MTTMMTMIASLIQTRDALRHAHSYLDKLINLNNKLLRILQHNMQVVEQCSEQFNLVLPSRQIAKRRDIFVNSVSSHTNLLTFVNVRLVLDVIYLALVMHSLVT